MHIGKLLRCGGLFALAGCAGQHTTNTGFIPDYQKLSHAEDHTRDLVYVSPGLEAGHYHKVIIDPVIWKPVAGAAELTPEQIQRVTTEFRTELHKGLSRHFQVIEDESCNDCADVLRVRAAVTNLRRSQWYYNAIPVVIGLGAAAAGAFAPPIPPPAPGGASEEIVVTGAAGGAPLVAIATYNNGMPWNAVGQFLPYAHAERAFALSSQLLDEQLTRASKSGA